MTEELRRYNPFSAGSSPLEGDPNLAKLRELAKKGENVEQMEAELVAVRQDLAVARSGIDSDSPLGKLFLRGYEGDLADVESVKAAATALGVPMKRWEEPE
jgi:hypothetical protein